MKVLPEPVTPSSTWCRSPRSSPRVSSSIACGWSPAGRSGPCELEAFHARSMARGTEEGRGDGAEGLRRAGEGDRRGGDDGGGDATNQTPRLPGWRHHGTGPRRPPACSPRCWPRSRCPERRAARARPGQRRRTPRAPGPRRQ
ncbi:MAG: hypothetical protein MZV63_06085 [Marinilabiliales bacterium]|nr:hypothetical protein [Marinilabiliales bacterium]